MSKGGRGKVGGAKAADAAPQRQALLKRWWEHPLVASFIALTSILGGVLLILGIVWPDDEPAEKTSAEAETEVGHDALRAGEAGATLLTLFDPAEEDVGTFFDSGSSVACKESRVSADPGTYACVVSFDPIPDVSPGTVGWIIADPCFGTADGGVVCALANGRLEQFSTVTAPDEIHEYQPQLENVGTSYPWRLVLSDGSTCLWDWYSTQDRGSEAQDLWACVATTGGDISDSGGAMLVPTYGGSPMAEIGTDPLSFDGTLAMNWTKVYVVDLELDQSETWTARVRTEGGDYVVRDVVNATY